MGAVTLFGGCSRTLDQDQCMLGTRVTDGAAWGKTSTFSRMTRCILTRRARRQVRRSS